MRVTKALSFQQPWLWLILNHYKDIEVRTWNTPFRGYFGLHASKTFDNIGFIYLRDNVFTNMPLKSQYSLGKILGIANLYSVIKFKDHQHFFQYKDRHRNNPFLFDGTQNGFVLQDVNGLVEPISYKGRLGLFNIDEVVVADAFVKEG